MPIEACSPVKDHNYNYSVVADMLGLSHQDRDYIVNAADFEYLNVDNYMPSSKFLINLRQKLKKAVGLS